MRECQRGGMTYITAINRQPTSFADLARMPLLSHGRSEILAQRDFPTREEGHGKKLVTLFKGGREEIVPPDATKIANKNGHPTAHQSEEILLSQPRDILAKPEILTLFPSPEDVKREITGDVKDKLDTCTSKGLKDRFTHIGHTLKHNLLVVSFIAAAPAVQGASESPAYIASVNKFLPSGIRDAKDIGIFSLLLGWIAAENVVVSMLANHYPISNQTEKKSKKEITAERMAHRKEFSEHFGEAMHNLYHGTFTPVKRRFEHFKQTASHSGETARHLYHGAIKPAGVEAYHAALKPLELLGNGIVWIGNQMEKCPLSLINKSGKHIVDTGRTLMFGPPLMVLLDRKKPEDKVPFKRIVKLSTILATLMDPVNKGATYLIRDVLYKGLDYQAQKPSVLYQTEELGVQKILSKYVDNKRMHTIISASKELDIQRLAVQGLDVFIHKLFYGMGELMNFSETTGQAFWGLLTAVMVGKAISTELKTRRLKKDS